MLKLKNLLLIPLRNASSNKVKPHKRPKFHNKVEAQIESLKARGFLRPQKAYDPPIPQEVHERINAVVSEMGGIKNFSEQKFEVLSKCSAAFDNHYVPNSQLHEIKNIDDVISFYEMKVDTRTPYEMLDTSVPNLHVLPHAKRYDPDEDGVSAFPKSSTLVTGLKYRNKYKGHVAKTSWP